MLDDELPGWAYPTREAVKLHFFPAKGQPSLCRRYIANRGRLVNEQRQWMTCNTAGCRVKVFERGWYSRCPACDNPSETLHDECETPDHTIRSDVR